RRGEGGEGTRSPKIFLKNFTGQYTRTVGGDNFEKGRKGRDQVPQNFPENLHRTVHQYRFSEIFRKGEEGEGPRSPKFSLKNLTGQYTSTVLSCLGTVLQYTMSVDHLDGG